MPGRLPEYGDLAPRRLDQTSPTTSAVAAKPPARTSGGVGVRVDAGVSWREGELRLYRFCTSPYGWPPTHESNGLLRLCHDARRLRTLFLASI